MVGKTIITNKEVLLTDVLIIWYLKDKQMKKNILGILNKEGDYMVKWEVIERISMAGQARIESVGC